MGPKEQNVCIPTETGDNNDQSKFRENRLGENAAKEAISKCVLEQCISHIYESSLPPNVDVSLSTSFCNAVIRFLRPEGHLKVPDSFHLVHFKNMLIWKVSELRDLVAV